MQKLRICHITGIVLLALLLTHSVKALPSGRGRGYGSVGRSGGPGGGVVAMTTLDGSLHQIAVDSMRTVVDSAFFNSSYGGVLDTNYSVQNQVTLAINESSLLYLKSAFTVTVKLRISYVTGSGASDTGSVLRTFTVNYDSTQNYNSRSSFVFKGGRQVTIKVLSVTSNVSTWDPTAALVIENRLIAKPNFLFDCSKTVGSIAVGTVADSADELPVSWTSVLGADQYDVEWTYIDSSALKDVDGYGRYKFGSLTNPDPVLLFQNNATRVTVSGTSYRIPLIYDNTGTLFIRVRPVQIKEGFAVVAATWSSEATSPVMGQFVFRGHERTLNWQSSISFAEEGKRKVVLQYYDGSLRSRQTVTKDNTTDTTIIAETYYDYQGRPALQVMPTPSLSNTIQYTAGFNVGLNGKEYSQSLYDSLGGATFCSIHADSMSNRSGASQYYSVNNPRRTTGMNQFIPDAKGYPFSETEYTPDNTGRISRQGGVGPLYQLASGHETKYYYSTPDQPELDALFGTEVGNKSHYFKNMVRDANGQYSIAYVDMHGRTIATALAGGAPASLKPLASNVDSTVTETLTDAGTAMFKDMTMLNQKTLVVTTPDSFQFKYQLDPSILNGQDCHGATVCYTCRYDLEVTISSDCNNGLLGGQPFDTVLRNFSLDTLSAPCSNRSLGFNFSLYLPEGSYVVTKKLTVNQDAYNYYRDSVYIPSNTCSTLQQFVNQQKAVIASTNTQCAPDCASCRDSVGDWPHFWANYIVKAGVTDDTRATDSLIAYSAYQDALNSCAALCADNLSDGDDIRNAMLQDMTPPFGQYADTTKLWSKYNIFYIPANDSDSYIPIYKRSSVDYKSSYGLLDSVYSMQSNLMVEPNSLSPEFFVQNFRPSWAEALLPYHPEYCKLLAMQAQKPSYVWDRKMEAIDNYQDALDSGFLNPTGSSAAPFNYYTIVTRNIDPLSQESTTYKNQLEAILKTYKPVSTNNFTTTLWGLAVAMVKCGSSDQACFTAYAKTTAAKPFDPSTMCVGDLDMAWRNFREIYLSAKQDIMNKIVNNPTGCTPLNDQLNKKVPSAATLFVDSMHAEFPDKDPSSPKTNILSQSYLGTINQAAGNSAAAAEQKNAVQNSLDSFYVQNANAMAQQWAKDLAACNYTDAQLATILPVLKGLCVMGSDADHPFGASSLPAGETYQGYTSFAGILAHFNQQYNIYAITDTLHCNAEMIKSPAPYDNQPIYSNKPVYQKPSSCECSLINGLYQRYKASHRIDVSFATYLKLTQQIDMKDGDLAQLLNMCSSKNGTGLGSCTWLSKPIYLPPAMQCNSGSTCVGCTVVNSLVAQYNLAYPGKAPAIGDPEDTVQTQKNVLFQNYMNNRLGYSKQAAEYIDFINTCAASAGSISNTLQCTTHTTGSLISSGVASAFADVHPSVTGGYILAGSMTPVGSSYKDAYIVNMDDTGGVKWAKSWGGSGDDYFNRVRQTSDRGYVAIGTTRSGAFSKGEVLIVKTDLNGSTLWKRAIGFGTSFGENGYDIIQTSDGGYAALGIYNQHGGTGDFILAKLDTTGAVSWVHQFGSSMGDNSTCTIDGTDTLPYTGTPSYGLLENNDTLMVSGTAFDKQKGTRYFGSVYRVGKAAGNLIGSWHYQDNTDSLRSLWLGDIFPTSNGFLLSAINSIRYGSDSTQAAVLNISKTGQVLSYHRAGLPAGSSKVLSSALVPTVDGGYMMAQTANNAQHIFWERMDGSDNVLWTKETVLPGNQVLGRMLQNAADSSFSVAGSTGGKGMLYTIPDISELSCYDSAKSIGRTNPGLTKVSWATLRDRTLVPSTTSIALTEAVVNPGDSILTCSGSKDCFNFYTGPTMCGKVAPIFASASQDSITACTDSTFFAVSKGTELYTVYKDSLTGDFEKKYKDLCLQAYKYEKFTVTHKDRVYHYTLYYYDQAGNLLKTVPPAGVHKFTNADTLDMVKAARLAGTELKPNHSLVTSYRYNSLNQVVAQFSPDGGTSHFWYDRLGRLALSQNARQRQSNQYSYTKYDSLGRIVQVGQLVSGAAITDTISRNEASLASWENSVAGTADQITVTVYDTANYGILPEMSPRNLRNRVSWTGLYNTAYLLSIDSANAATHYSYDMLGNVDTLVQDFKQGIMATIAGNRHKKIVYDYDLVSGKVNKVSYQDGEADAFYHSYVYDAENRIVNVQTSADGINWDNDAYYSYYMHGPLARTILGEQQVQGINYAYNLQGWMKSINPGIYTGGSYTLRPDSVGHVVAASAYNLLLNYHNGDYSPISGVAGPDYGVSDSLGADYRPLYNGNISSMGANVRGLGNAFLYNYQYDQLNRLVGMDAWNKKGAAWNSLTKLPDFGERIAYDPNGNILQYQRNGNHTFADKQIAMDSLGYKYIAGTNQLDHITDTVLPGRYDNDIDGQSAGNYKYDSIGQLVSDAASGISNISWTVYGKIASITKGGDTTILYTYDAGGHRISKTVKHGTDSTVIWYVRDAQGNVMSVYTYGDPEVQGRQLAQTEVDLYGSSRLGMLKRSVNVEMAPAVTTSLMPLLGTGDSVIFTRGNKLFELTNHLGNVLATISDKRFGVVAAAGDANVAYYIPELVSANDYYPFGSLQPKRGYAKSGRAYRYGFNGKERNDEVVGIGNEYDFGARIYDPRLGRWLSPDPLEKKYPSYSPYNFAVNSPIITIDLDGEDIIIVTSNGAVRLAKETLLKTPSGKALWNKYAKSKTVDVYIAVGKMPKHEGANAETLFDAKYGSGVFAFQNKLVVDEKNPAISHFKVFDGVDVSKSKGKTIALVFLNDASFSDKSSDKKKYANDFLGGDAAQIKYDLAESIYHEIKAHIDLHGARANDEHKAYGKSVNGVFRTDILPKKGTPAAKIEEELKADYDKEKATKPDVNTTDSSKKV